MAITRTLTKTALIYACDLCGWQRGSRLGKAHWDVCPQCHDKGPARRSMEQVNIMNDQVIEQAKRPQKRFPKEKP